MKPIKNGKVNGVSLIEVARKYGTPLYVYDLETIKQNYDDLFRFFEYDKLKIFYAMKANYNLDILRWLESNGSGIDAVSIGDIRMAKKAGFSNDRIIYTANNITDKEMDIAVKEGVLINIGEMSRLRRYASDYPDTDICIRINPEVIAGESQKVQTGGTLAKFGILAENLEEVRKICTDAGIRIVGIHEHTGSGISESDQIVKAIEYTLKVASDFKELKFVDFGGGFKVPYRPDEKEVDYISFGKKITGMFKDFSESYGREINMYFEPGKYLVAQSGMLLVQVNTLRDNRGRLFAGVDSGFPQLIRPVFYDAYHHILNLSAEEGCPCAVYDIVGNICEGGDIFAKQRELPSISEGDYLCIQNAGAYCYSMGGVYNLRPMPSEVVIDKTGNVKLSTKAEEIDDMIDRLN